jgi:hypothetical protein
MTSNRHQGQVGLRNSPFLYGARFAWNEELASGLVPG